MRKQTTLSMKQLITTLIISLALISTTAEGRNRIYTFNHCAVGVGGGIRYTPNDGTMLLFPSYTGSFIFGPVDFTTSFTTSSKYNTTYKNYTGGLGYNIVSLPNMVATLGAGASINKRTEIDEYGVSISTTINPMVYAKYTYFIQLGSKQAIGFTLHTGTNITTVGITYQFYGEYRRFKNR